MASRANAGGALTWSRIFPGMRYYPGNGGPAAAAVVGAGVFAVRCWLLAKLIASIVSLLLALAVLIPVGLAAGLGMFATSRLGWTRDGQPGQAARRLQFLPRM